MAEWLRQIVVGTQIQSTHPCVLGTTRRQDNDGSVAAGRPELLKQVEAICIQNDYRRPHCSEEFQCRSLIVCCRGAKPSPVQCMRDEFDQLPISICNENLHSACGIVQLMGRSWLSHG
jgi:hypothetical protein